MVLVILNVVEVFSIVRALSCYHCCYCRWYSLMVCRCLVLLILFEVAHVFNDVSTL